MADKLTLTNTGLAGADGPLKLRGIAHTLFISSSDDRWLRENPTLVLGEMVAVETEDGRVRLKVGDGINRFTDLPWISGDETIPRLPDNLVYASEYGEEDEGFMTYDSTLITDETTGRDYRLSLDNKQPYLKEILEDEEGEEIPGEDLPLARVEDVEAAKEQAKKDVEAAIKQTENAPLTEAEITALWNAVFSS